MFGHETAVLGGLLDNGAEYRRGPGLESGAHGFARKRTSQFLKPLLDLIEAGNIHFDWVCHVSPIRPVAPTYSVALNR